MNLVEQTRNILEILGDGFPLHRLELILQHKEMILDWLNSKVFQEKYAKHAYPPLMDPSKVVWEKTDPFVAWDLNLPLPPFYSMFYLCPHGVGTGAMLSLLRTSGGGGISYLL